MKALMPFAMLVFILAGVQSSRAASSSELLADLVAGHCLSELTGSPLPESFTDPRKAGKPVSVTLAQGVVPGLQVRAFSGFVTTYRSEPYCTVQANGLRLADTVTRIETALKAVGRAAEKTPATPVGNGLIGMILMVTIPLDSPKVPVIVLRSQEREPQGLFQAAVTLGQ